MKKTGWMIYLVCLAGACMHCRYPSHWLFIPIAGLVLMNAAASFHWIWNREGKSWHVLGINVFQLALFGMVFHSLFQLGGDRYYEFSAPPEIGDWCKFLAIHILRAADFMDFIEGYGWEIQSLKTSGYVSGTPVVLLHLLVDFFLFTSLYKLFMRSRFSKPLLEIALRASKAVLVLGVILLTGFFFSDIQTLYPFLIWMAACSAMGAAFYRWGTEEVKTEIPAGCADVVFGTGCLLFFLLLLLAGPLWTIVYVFLLSCYLMKRVRLTYVFFPLFLFTLAFGGFCHWIAFSHPAWIEGPINPFIFPLENLFRAIDLLDTSYVYNWNWSGGKYDHWLFASVVVSYRFLASAFFYKAMYRLIILHGFGKSVPLEKTISMLKDDDLSVRLAAETQLKISGDKRSVGYLLPFLKEEDPGLKMLALEVCGRLAGKEAIPEIVECLMQMADQPNLQGMATSALRKFDAVDVAQALSVHLKSEQEIVRIQALRAATQLDVRKNVPEIASLLEDPVPSVRDEAVYAIDRLQGRECLPKIASMLEKGDLERKQTAMRVIARLNAREFVLRLIPFLSSEEKEMQEAALQTLVELKAREAIPFITSLLDIPERRKSALEALGDLKSVESAPLLVPFLGDQDPGVREKTRFVLTVLGTAVVPSLEPLLRGKNDLLKAEAIGVLTDLKVEAFSCEIRPMLQEESRNVRCAAIRYLGEMGTVKDSEDILPSLREEGEISREATRALIKLGRMGCAVCRRAQITEMESGKFWCAWCQGWTQVERIDSYPRM